MINKGEGIEKFENYEILLGKENWVKIKNVENNKIFSRIKNSVEKGEALEKFLNYKNKFSTEKWKKLEILDLIRYIKVKIERGESLESYNQYKIYFSDSQWKQLSSLEAHRLFLFIQTKIEDEGQLLNNFLRYENVKKKI